MYVGACYYPEHWPEERWDIDIQWMKEARFNIVRMAEFAWSRLEPEPGRYDFAWLDHVIERMGNNGIQVILGTPTSGPPKWLMDCHPDIYPRDIYGQVRGFGTRRHYCFNSRTYAQYTQAIVTQMAAHYQHNPHVIGWQIDNEFGCINTTRCYCERCRASFIDWLRSRYGSLDLLNEAWGTIFSSQVYTQWEQLHLPTYAVHQMHNQGLALDYRRFASDSVRKYQRLQADSLRKYCPAHTITTNEMGIFNEIDYYGLSEDLDICSLDIYPSMKREPHDVAYYAAVQHDMTRGFKDSNYWVTEHQSGTPGALVLHPTPRPGELRRWTYQSVGRGADAIMYFRWRTCTFALEEYWHGILQHHGERSRKYDEVKQVGEELSRLAPLLERTTPIANVAIIRCFHNEWVFELQPHVQGYTYMDHLLHYYRYFFKQGIQVDVVGPSAELDRYDLVITPNLIMSEPDLERKLYAYVSNGGTLIADFRAGAKRWDNRMNPSKLPGPYRELLGIEFDDYGILNGDRKNGVSLAAGTTEVSEAKHWYDVIELRGAEPVMVYTQDYCAGAPAVTRHSYGRGEAYYVGTELEQIEPLLGPICREAGVKPMLPSLPPDVEVTSRAGEQLRLLFVINHHHESRTVELPGVYSDLLTGRRMAGSMQLPGNGVWVLKDGHDV